VDILILAAILVLVVFIIHGKLNKTHLLYLWIFLIVFYFVIFAFHSPRHLVLNL